MPGFQQDSDSIGATSQVDNIWAGNQFEFADVDMYFDAGFTASATGLLVSLFVAERTLFRDSIPNVRSAAPQNPVYPDDYLILNAPALAGERFVCTVRNTTGGALTIISCLRQRPG